MKEMLTNDQLMITDLYNILIGNVKKMAPYVFPYENLHLSQRLGLKLKKYTV